MSRSWVKIEKPASVQFKDIMSDEILIDLEAKKAKKYWKKYNISTAEQNESEHTTLAILKSTLSDENDGATTQNIEELNKSLKSSEDYSKAADYDEEIVDMLDWDRVDLLEREFAIVPQVRDKGRKHGKMVSRQDVIVNGKGNTGRLLCYPELRTAAEDVKLRDGRTLHSNNENSAVDKFHKKKKDHAFDIAGIDQFARLLLFKMIENRLLRRVTGVIIIGSDAVILHATTNQSYPKAREHLPRKCVVKIFKTTSEYKQRNRHFLEDDSFKDKITRNPIHLRAEKQMVNLVRLRKLDIPCPRVILLKQHILVMSFIGTNYLAPAPKLKDAELVYYEYATAYEQIISAMKTVYDDVNLILGNISETSILWYQKQCYFVDVSQSVYTYEENAFDFLYKDCSSIVNFFASKEVPNIQTADELFKSITGYNFKDKFALTELEESSKMKKHQQKVT